MTTATLIAHHATTKLAQTATGRKTCQRCGRTHPLATWPIHARFKKPLNICGDCLAESRVRAGKKHSATKAAKRAERAAMAAVAVPAEAVSVAMPPLPTTGTAVLLIAKFEGYAMGKDDDALASLLVELQEAIR